MLIGGGRITGNVLLCRSPCMFPSDIQKVQAVKVPHDERYDNLQEVIVFNAKGQRPLADFLGGGDFDVSS